MIHLNKNVFKINKAIVIASQIAQVSIRVNIQTLAGISQS